MSTTADILSILEALTPEAATRLKSLVVSSNGATLELYPEGLKQLAGGQLVSVSDNPVESDLLEYGEEDDEDDGAFALDGHITLAAYVDLLTLVAASAHEPFHVEQVATWLDVPATLLRRYLDEDGYGKGLDLWYRILTPEEQHLLKVAVQNIVLVNPKGTVEDTVEHLSNSEDISEAMRRYITDRWTLNQQVAAALEAPLEVSED